jgi:hypothetical protein
VPPTRRSAPRLSDAQLGSLLELVKESDSVELKLTVPSSAHRATIQGLPIDPVEAQPRQVFFFDTPNLDLDKAGLVVRARRMQGGRADTVVKLRPVVPSELPDEVRRSGSFNVEVDAMPGGYVCSGSMKGKSTAAEVSDAVRGAVPLRKVFTKEQRAFFAAHAPAGVGLDALVPLGPTFILKLVWFPQELNRKFVAELWLYQDGSRILELSTKCLPNETFQVAAEARSYLAKFGVVVGGAQQTKTRTALEFFRAELSAAAKPKRGPGRPRGSTTRGRTTTGTRTTRSTRGRPAGATAAASTATPSTAATAAGATGAAPAPTAAGRRRTTATKTTRVGSTTRRAATSRKASTAKPPTAKPPTPKASAPKTGGTTRRTRRPSA